MREYLIKEERKSRLLDDTREALADQPAMGIGVEELPGTQDLVTGDYSVRYAVLEEDLYILRIWHGKEDR